MIINFTNSTSKYTATLLKEFSNLELLIDDNLPPLNNTYQIPIKFSSASRLYKKLSRTQDNEFTYRTPIIALSLLPDGTAKDRMTNPILKKRVLQINDDEVQISFNDKPVNLNYELTIIADSLTTLTNIKDFVNSYFVNDIKYVDIDTILGETISTPIRLTSISTNIENNEDAFDDNRFLECVIGITIEGVVHSNFITTSKRIKEVNLYLHHQNIISSTLIEEYKIID